MSKKPKDKDDEHTATIPLENRHSEALQKYAKAWESHSIDYKEFFPSAKVVVGSDKVTIAGDKTAVKSIRTDIDQFFDQHVLQDRIIAMSESKAEAFLEANKREVQQLKKENIDDGEITISAINKGLLVTTTPEILNILESKIHEIEQNAAETSDKSKIIQKNFKKPVSPESREKMLNGECDEDVKQELKITRNDFEITKDTEVPRSIGLLLVSGDPNALGNLREEIASNEKVKQQSNELTTDKMATKMVSVHLTVNINVSRADFQHDLGSGFINETENECKTIIEERTESDSDTTQSAFLHDYEKVEVQDQENDYAVYFCCGDVTTFACDAIVNSSNIGLSFDGTLSGDIQEKGGKAIVEECEDFINKHGHLEVGDIYVSTAGDLDCKIVIHVASPQWQDGKQNEETELSEAVKKLLQKADELNMYSVALPALSAGGYGFPQEKSVMAIFSAVKDYFAERKSSGKSGLLKKISLVDINPEVIDKITDAMKECFGSGKVCDEQQKKQRNAKKISYQVLAKSQEEIDKVLAKLQGKCKGMAVAISQVPPAWSPMHDSELYKVDQLSTRSIDYKELEKMFTKSIENSTIVKIERIQNRELYKRFLDHKELIKQETTWRNNYEMKLWHGTHSNGAEGIKKDGFSLKYVGKSFGTALGRGVYFAKTASTSHGYTDAGANGYHYMFRCTVLTGKSKETAVVKSTSAPKGYHSVNGWGMEAYCVFRDTQCYPDYLITYQIKKQGDGCSMM